MTLIVKACAAYSQIDNVQICLRKRPVLAGKGSLGVRLIVETGDLAEMRRVQQ